MLDLTTPHRTAYVLRGSPASGKTTVTEILVQAMQGRVATLGGIIRAVATAEEKR